MLHRIDFVRGKEDWWIMIEYFPEPDLKRQFYFKFSDFITVLRKTEIPRILVEKLKKVIFTMTSDTRQTLGERAIGDD